MRAFALVSLLVAVFCCQSALAAGASGAWHGRLDSEVLQPLRFRVDRHELEGFTARIAGYCPATHGRWLTIRVRDTRIDAHGRFTVRSGAVTLSGQFRGRALHGLLAGPCANMEATFTAVPASVPVPTDPYTAGA